MLTRWTIGPVVVLLAVSVGCRNEREAEPTAVASAVAEPPPLVTYDVRISTQPPHPMPRLDTQVSLRVVSSAGVQPQFDDVVGSPVHLVVVRRDLRWYQHLHPQRNGDSFTTLVRFPSDGTYVFHSIVDPVGHVQLVTKQDVIVGKAAGHAPRGLKVSGREERRGHYTIRLRCDPEPPAIGEWSSLIFSIARDGVPVTDLMPTGTLGHMVILREGGEDFVYAHSTDGEAMNGVRALAHSPALPPGLDSHTNHPHDTGPDVTFHTRFPREGTYKMWVDFLAGSDSIKADFVVKAEKREPPPHSD